jgi:hypothetical protein
MRTFPCDVLDPDANSGSCPLVVYSHSIGRSEMRTIDRLDNRVNAVYRECEDAVHE